MPALPEARGEISGGMIDLVFWFWPCRGCIRQRMEVFRMIIEIAHYEEMEKDAKKMEPVCDGVR